ncbi:MAG: F0F1 ATP synthase subunit B [Actinomycetota bacterium]
MLQDTAFALMLAAEEEPSGIDLILPETAELIWGIISFVVVAVVLTRIAFPKLKEVVDQRAATIQKDLEDAEASKSEAQGMLDEYKKQMADARSEANRVIEDSRQQAEQVRKDIIAKAEKDSESIVARAQEQIQAERSRAVTELQATISNLSIELAEKVVGRSIDASAQKDLVDAYIKDVGDMSPNGGRNN